MLNRILLFLFLSLLFWGFGCSDNATDSGLTEGPSGLDDLFGDYNVSDEKPAFDDPDLLAQIDNDGKYKDPILDLADVDSMLADGEAGFYHLRIVWGQLCLDTTVSVATDWSGSLTVNRGAEIIRRVIRFEPNTDYILPRTDRKLVEWVSRTTVHNDGIAVDIVIPRPIPVVDTTTDTVITPELDTVVAIVVDTVFPVLEPVEVAFKTGPYSSTFTLAEISALDTIIYLDDSSAVTLHGLKLDHRPCPRGFLSGVWGTDDQGQGVFSGLWVARNGDITGFLRGQYGNNDDGLNVFKGKWISRSGEFQGLLAGHYGHRSDCDTAVATLDQTTGYFRGIIYSEERVEIGVLKGKYRSSPRVDDGFFQGRWRITCPDISDESDDDLENF